MNRFIGIGRLVADPDIRMSTSGTKIARYRLAINRRPKEDGTQEADFLSCLCFNKTADFVERYLRKGMKIAIAGRIQTGSYDDKDGKKVYTTDIIVEEHEFCESKGNSGNTAPDAGQGYGYQQRQYGNLTITPRQQSFIPQRAPRWESPAGFSTADLDGFAPVDDDNGDLPF